jgi:hypothetical protein
MKQSKRIKSAVNGDQSLSQLKVFLKRDEMNRFESYLESRGAKKGPFLRQMILRLLAEDDAVRLGRSQLDPAYFAAQAKVAQL